jgi:hypothetical protein
MRSCTRPAALANLWRPVILRRQMAAHAADAVQWFACHLGNTTWQQLSGLFAILLRQCSAAVCIQSAVCSLRASVSMYYRRRTRQRPPLPDRCTKQVVRLIAVGRFEMTVQASNATPASLPATAVLPGGAPGGCIKANPGSAMFNAAGGRLCLPRLYPVAQRASELATMSVRGWGLH